MAFLKVIPGTVSTADLHQYLLGAVAPRPICFASTVDEAGNKNLAPYSFFNVYSSNPPIAIFSSNRRVAGNTTKDTLANVMTTKEVVINVVSHSIVRQMAIASVEFESGISEFEKAGLTAIPSEKVRPYRVQESPVQMECVVKEIMPLGDEGGAGNLIICEVVMMHIAENILDEGGKIDPDKIDLMGRMGRAFYTRASGAAVTKIFQAVKEIPIGVDALPSSIRNSTVLTGNDLGILGGQKDMPSEEMIDSVQELPEAIGYKQEKREANIIALHQKIKNLVEAGEIERALALCFIA